MATRSDELCVWFRDDNSRVYEGKRLLERPKWKKIPIVKVTRTHYHLARSVWFIGRDITRIPKCPSGDYFQFSELGVDEQVWLREHKHAIHNLLGKSHSAAIWREVAKLVGYQPENHP